MWALRDGCSWRQRFNHSILQDLRHTNKVRAMLAAVTRDADGFTVDRRRRVDACGTTQFRRGRRGEERGRCCCCAKCSRAPDGVCVCVVELVVPLYVPQYLQTHTQRAMAGSREKAHGFTRELCERAEPLPRYSSRRCSCRFLQQRSDVVSGDLPTHSRVWGGDGRGEGGEG